MTEFHTAITQYATGAVQSLCDARESGDDYLASVREAELENLARLASEHGLRVPELNDYNAVVRRITASRLRRRLSLLQGPSV
jgi:hypothetical protein